MVIPASDLFDLSGQVALVTGGGRGIGLAIAQGLGRHGARVCLADLDSARVDRAAAQLALEGVEAQALEADISSSGSVEPLFDRLMEREGKIDIVVNNAGISARIPAEAYPDDELDRMVDLNMKGVFLRDARCCFALD